MALGQMYGGHGRLFVGAVLSVACGALGGCGTVVRARLQPSIVTDPELAAETQRLERKLSLEDRVAMNDEILEREDVLIHVIPGDLSGYKTRGGASDLASSDFSKKFCKKHPQVEGVPNRRNWDVVIDRQLAEAWANKCGIRNPPDVILYHEIYGHILWLFRRPKVSANKKIYDFLEGKARIIENRYRMQQMLEEVPEYMEPCFP